jgi:hypothetical protein
MPAGVEALEGRCLMAAAAGRNAFLSVSGALTTRGQRDAIPIAVSPEAFDLPGDRVLLGVTVSATRPGRLDPGRVDLAPAGDGGRLDVVRIRSDTPGDRSCLMLADVTPGAYVSYVQAERRTTGAYRLDIGLAGDADANFRVDAQDLTLIRSLQGRRAGRSGYRVDADVDRDGRINGADLDLATRNLGASWHPAPALTARLDAQSDPDGNLRVLRPTVVVVGHAAPGARVVLDAGADGSADRATMADALGAYRFDVGLSYGANPLRVTAFTPSGSSATIDLTVERSDVVLDWNEVLLDAIRADRTAPPRAARALAIVHVAAYDAVAAIDPTHAPYALHVSVPPWVSAEAAVASAAHRALVALFPARAAAFDAALATTLADVPDGPAEAWGVDLGRASAETILALRRFDGSDVTLNYSTASLPGQWRPTPEGFAAPLLPQWPFVVPFALARPDEVRPAGPPALTSTEYAADVDEVRRLGRANSTERTPDQTQIARFWADGAGTATPPGHWNQIAVDVARQRNTTLGDNARLFALLNIALADAGIASWDAKYFYGVWRPITAIREADTDGNPRTSADPSWTPLLATPPFPTYTSGHSTFSCAASEVLSSFFGPATAFVTDSEDVPGVTRAFTSFAQAADEAGRSRIYGGIHFEFDNRDGLASGRAVGRFVTRTQLV